LLVAVLLAAGLSACASPSIDNEELPAPCSSAGAVSSGNGCQIDWTCTSNDKDVDLLIECDANGACLCKEAGTEVGTFTNDELCDRITGDGDSADFRDGVASSGCGWFLDTSDGLIQ
jgi:hypothetical protein